MVRITRGMAARMEPEREPEQQAEPQQPASTSTSTNLTVPIMENTIKLDTTTTGVIELNPAVAESVNPNTEPQSEPAPIDPSVKPVERPKRKRILTEKLKARRAAYNCKKRQQALADIKANSSAMHSSSLRAGRPQSFRALQKLFLQQQQEIKQLRKQAAKSAATPIDGSHAGQS